MSPETEAWTVKLITTAERFARMMGGKFVVDPAKMADVVRYKEAKNETD